MNTNASSISQSLVNGLLKSWPKYADQHSYVEGDFKVTVIDAEPDEPGRIETRYNGKRITYFVTNTLPGRIHEAVEEQVNLLLHGFGSEH